jgi:hypothetical protein
MLRISHLMVVINWADIYSWETQHSTAPQTGTQSTQVHVTGGRT